MVIGRIAIALLGGSWIYRPRRFEASVDQLLGWPGTVLREVEASSARKAAAKYLRLYREDKLRRLLPRPPAYLECTDQLHLSQRS